MTSRKFSILLLTCVAILLLSACNGSSKNDTTATTRPTIEVASGSTSVTYNYSDETVADGEAYFGTFCISCHGPEARGIPSLGPNLVESEFVRSHTDEELLAFVIEGRPADHPDNETGVLMPARAGFPNLQDEQILSIIAYVRSLQ